MQKGKKGRQLRKAREGREQVRRIMEECRRNGNGREEENGI